MLIAQLLDKDDSLSNHIRDKVMQADTSELQNTGWLKGIARNAIFAQNECYMIIDGLDECESEQQRSTLNWLIDNIMKDSTSVGAQIIELLISGQPNGVIDQHLYRIDQIVPVTELRPDDEPSHFHDISMFSSKRIAEIREKFLYLDKEDFWEKNWIRYKSPLLLMVRHGDICLPTYTPKLVNYV